MADGEEAAPMATTSSLNSRGGANDAASVTITDVTNLQPFNARGDPHSVSQRWKIWKRAFRLYVAGKGVVNDAQKKGLLLHSAGLEVQEIFFSREGEDENKDYAATLQTLDGYFIPKSHVPFERHVFRQLCQNSGETVDQFVCRLRQRATTCDFKEKTDEHIRDQLIDKCLDPRLRRRFLEKEGDSTLDGLLTLARAFEAVDARMKIMGESTGLKNVLTMRELQARFKRFHHTALEPSKDLDHQWGRKLCTESKKYS